MSGSLMEHLVDFYQGEGVFSLNKNEFKMRLKDLALIPGLRVVNPVSNQTRTMSQYSMIDFSLT